MRKLVTFTCDSKIDSPHSFVKTVFESSDLVSVFKILKDLCNSCIF